MKIRITHLLLLLSLFSGALYANDTQAASMSLQQCLVYARDHSSVNIQSKYSNEQQRISVQNNAMQFLPYISASANANISFGRGIDPETNTFGTKQTLGTGFGLSMSLPLFDGLVNINSYKISRSNLRESQSLMQQRADEISLAVIKAFYNVVYYKELLSQVESVLDKDRKTLLYTQRQYQLGLMSQADVDEMTAIVAEDEYSLVNQQNLLDVARLELKNAMSWPLEKDIEVNDSLTTPIDNDKVAYSASVLHLPAAKIAEENLRQSKLSVRIARGNFFPSISLSAGVSTSYYKTLNMGYKAQPFHRQFKDNMGEYISTGISFPLFGRLSKYNNLRSSKLSHKMQQAAYDETIRSLQTEARRLAMNLEGARKEYLAAISRLKAVESSHEANLRKYELGNISALELSTSNVRLSQARATLTGKQIQYIIQNILCEYYNGKPYINEQ